MMKHVSILVPEQAVLAAIDDPRHVFSQVNRFYEKRGESAIFDINFVGAAKEIKLHDGAFSVHTNLLLDEVEKTDLIFVPAFSGDANGFLDTNKSFVSWIVEQNKKGAEVVSLCVGAFMLAQTGLLDGKKCSTHWNAADEFDARRAVACSVAVLRAYVIVFTCVVRERGRTLSRRGLASFLSNKGVAVLIKRGALAAMRQRRRTGHDDPYFNPKRTLRGWTGSKVDRAYGAGLAGSVNYTGNPAHKRNPAISG